MGHPGHGGRKAWRWYLNPALPGSELAFPPQAKASIIRVVWSGAFSLLTPASHTAKPGEGGSIEETRARRTIQARDSSYDAEPSPGWLPTPSGPFRKSCVAAMAPICHFSSSRNRSLSCRPSSGCQKLPSWLSLGTRPSHPRLLLGFSTQPPPQPHFCAGPQRDQGEGEDLLSKLPLFLLPPTHFSDLKSEVSTPIHPI